MLCAFNLSAQDVNRTVSKGDSINVSIKFKGETTTQQQINSTLLNNAANTNATLATSIVDLTSSIKQGLDLARETRIEKVAQQLNISKEDIYKALKRNNTYKLVGLIPSILVIFYALYSLLIKGADLNNALKGAGMVAILVFLLSIALYFGLTLIFNNEFFLIKGLLFSPY
jgi:NACalpha-BTF3-like transcription factor